MAGFFSKGLQSFLLSLFIFFCFTSGAGAGFVAGPVEVKVKEQEGEFLRKYDLAATYKAKDWRWNLDAVLYDPMSYQRLSRVKNTFRFRTESGWWLGGEGSYSFEPACDYWWLRLLTEKRNTKSWSWKLWSDGEWRLTNTGYTLDEYSYSEHGVRVGWTPWKKIRCTGQLTKRVKDYAVSPNSWRKYDLRTEGKGSYRNHDLIVAYTESSGTYPENAWGNYWSNSVGVDWAWQITPSTRVRLDHSRRFQEWGNGKQRRERDFLAVVEYPKSATFTVAWMYGVKESVGQLVLIDEVREEDADLRSRIGLRLTKDLPGPRASVKNRIRAELFQKAKEEGEEYGWLLIMSFNYGDIRWELGLAPQGGFGYSAEKGYWIKAKYYLP
jgi:hypothetical protein